MTPIQAAGRRDRQRPAQKQVRCPRESLRVRVQHQVRRRDRGQHQRQRIQLPRREHENAERHYRQTAHFWSAQKAARQMTVRRPRILRVDMSVYDAVRRHSHRSRADHRHRNPGERPPSRKPVRRQRHPDVRERQRKDALMELDCVHEQGRFAPQRPYLDIARQNPYSLHLPSTRRLTSSSITMSGGQSLDRPSPATFAVASIPILLPNFGVGAA